MRNVKIDLWGDFLKWIEPVDQCWIWRKNMDGFGYGYIQKGAASKIIKVHRFSYDYYNGSIPQNIFVCHTCNNPRCVNPKHLVLGDYKDNAEYMSISSRCYNGKTGPNPEKIYDTKIWKPSIEERFFSRIRFAKSGCWEWSNSVSADGYGSFWFNKKNIRAHRWAYEYFVGPIQDGMQVNHHCDNPPCVNPKHLYVGTNKDNMRDMVNRGRSLTGDRNPSRTHPEKLKRGDENPARLHPEKMARGSAHKESKLTELQVTEIRNKYIPKTVPMYQLAKQYNVSTSLIFNIIKRKTWKHI